MEQRRFARLGRTASVIGLGTWQLGADWGTVDEDDAMEILRVSFEDGVTFFDTADVYGDGRSERFIGRFLRDLGSRAPELFVATKMGRRAVQEPDNFHLDNFRAWNDRSREYLGVGTLDLVQLHCPPSAVFDADAVYDALDTMVDEGRIAAYGVSVERCDEALAAIRRPNVASVQIILNAFRLKPLEQVIPAAQSAGVAIIARVPLASGLLAAKFTRDSKFGDDDHRNYNRHGEQFDVGETFSGVDYDQGIEASTEFAALAPDGMTAAQFALRWVIDQPGVTTVIPGATTVEQARANAHVAALAPLTSATLSAVADVYDERIRAGVHHRW